MTEPICQCGHPASLHAAFGCTVTTQKQGHPWPCFCPDPTGHSPARMCDLCKHSKLWHTATGCKGDDCTCTENHSH
jgi:hypothetical protein